MRGKQQQGFSRSFKSWLLSNRKLPYLFEYNAHNFLLKKELKVWVRVINEGWGDTLRCISILFAQWLKVKQNFIPIFNQKLGVRVIHVCALYSNKYGIQNGGIIKSHMEKWRIIKAAFNQPRSSARIRFGPALTLFYMLVGDLSIFYALKKKRSKIFLVLSEIWIGNNHIYYSELQCLCRVFLDFEMRS